MKKKSFFIGAFAIFLALLPNSVSALNLIDEAKLYFYGLNGIYFYRGNKDNCGEQNYAGNSVWSSLELEMVSENQPIYEEAANEYGFPWQILAVLHSMETSLRRYNPENGQGVYQLYSYTAGGSNENRFEPANSISEEEFRRQTKIAAGLVASQIGDANDSNSVKRFFFAFNGKSPRYIEKALKMGFSQEEAENGEGSPYVMNRYDARRDPTSSEMDPAWPGRFVKDGVYDPNSTSVRFGAYVKYEALYGSIDCPEHNSGDIVAAALLLSWDGHGHSKNDPKPEYIKAMKEVGTSFTPCRSAGDCAPVGASCDIFVSTVMRYSGSDPSFPATGPGVQEQYMASRPNMYMKVNASDVSQLLPGDILVTSSNGRHIYINLGGGLQASASYNDRTAEHFPGVYLTDHGSTGLRRYSVYRRIN